MKSAAISSEHMLDGYVQTMESVWKRPEEHAWRVVPSEDHPGHSYYFNDLSGDASWDKPETLAWEKGQFNPHLDAITL
jgi:hypothetical protein